ncbi:hypothetical protein OK414_29235 [Priestia sp. JV24]|nr:MULTISPECIES: hypothetical protein [Priestia]MCU7713051.1 hypothetical protein [Priestia megaterium]MCW1049138.1 hypothetical protein [Priestia sp. JV24]
MSLSGTQLKKEPLSQNGSAEGSFSGVCSFLYIVDMTEFSLQENEEMMNKKRTFYSYAEQFK